MNLIESSFATHADGWYTLYAGPAISWNAGAMVLASDGYGAAAAYRPRGVPCVALNGLTALDIVGSARCVTPTATVKINLHFAPDASLEPGWDVIDTATFEVGGGSSVPFEERGIEVPPGVTHVLISVVADNGIGDGGIEMAFPRLYVGTPGGDGDPDPDVPLPLVERVYNGDFEVGIAGWQIYWGGETLSHETSTPLTGTGSLRVDTAGAHEAEGVLGGNLPSVVVPGETLRFLMKATGSGAAEIGLLYPYSAEATVLWTGPLTAEPVAVDVTTIVPADQNAAYPFARVVGTQTTTLVLDDVSLDTPPGMTPPTTAFSGAYSGRMARRIAGLRGGR